MAKFGQSTAGFVGIGNVGIFTGTEIDTEVPRKKFGGTLTVPKKELVATSRLEQKTSSRCSRTCCYKTKVC
jgi:hypothetical protein